MRGYPLSREKYSSFLADAKLYDDIDLLRDDLDLLYETVR